MNKKVLAIIIGAIIIISGTIGVVAYQIFNKSSIPLITVTYTTHPIDSSSYRFINNSSTVTYIEVGAIFNCSKHFGFTETKIASNSSELPTIPNSLNINDFYLTSEGHPLTTYILTMGNTAILNSTNGVSLQQFFDFTVMGNVTSYQLAYNGTEGVKIILENP